MRAEDGTASPAAVSGTDENGVRITVVVPVLNAMKFLPRTMPPLLEAASNTEGVKLLYVDKGWRDGSYEYLSSVEANGVSVARIEREPGAAKRNLSAAARNFGARNARGEFLSFIDADCIVGKNYFNEAIDV